MLEFVEQLGLGPGVAALLIVGVRIAIIVLLALIAYRLLIFVVRRVVSHIQSLDQVENSSRDKRVQTLFELFTNASMVVVVTVALLMVLLELGIEVAPLLASLGIVGLALGLGAQQLVEDVISGIFIFVENQFAVGDIIVIDERSGTVEDVTLRVTKVRALDGVLHIIPNGEIRIVANKTRSWSRVLLDVGITYEDDVDEALEALRDAGQMLLDDEQLSLLVLDEPYVTGVEGLDDWQVRLRILVKTRPGAQFEVARQLRLHIRNLFAERGLALATPRQEIVVVTPE